MRKVRDIMSAAPVCMAPGESVSAAARAMKEQGIGTVLVLTDGRISLDESVDLPRPRRVGGEAFDALRDRLSAELGVHQEAGFA